MYKNRDRNSIYKKAEKYIVDKCSCCFSLDAVRRMNSEEIARNSVVINLAKGGKPQPRKSSDGVNGHVVRNTAYTITRVDTELEELDPTTHQNLYKNVTLTVDTTVALTKNYSESTRKNRNESPLDGTPSNSVTIESFGKFKKKLTGPGNLDERKSVVEYSNYDARNANLSLTHIEISLSRLNSNGLITGKRGAVQIKKIKQEVLEKRKNEFRNADNVGIDAEVDNPNDLPLMVKLY